MEFPDSFNQLDLLETHGHLIPLGTASPWPEEEEEEEEGERSEEWYQQHERRLEHSPALLMLWAAERNRLATIERLLSSDRSLVGCHDDDGYTPLHRAAYSGHVAVVRALLAAGAELQARTADNWTPLHSACRWGHTGVASCLLRWGSDVNAQTAGRLTPLHLAAGNPTAGRTLELLLSQRLLQAGLRNAGGETAYDIARRTSTHYCLFELAEPCNNTH